MVADWIVAARGVDPVPDLRGAYADEAGAKAAIAEAGGLPSLFADRLAAIGLAPAGDPQPGDVAVVGWRGQAFGAIRTKAGWAVKTTRGLVVSLSFVPLKCWTV